MYVGYMAVVAPFHYIVIIYIIIYSNYYVTVLLGFSMDYTLSSYLSAVHCLSHLVLCPVMAVKAGY